MLKKAFSWVVHVQLCIADFGKMLYYLYRLFQKKFTPSKNEII